MKQFTYNEKTDDFSLTVSPDELDTIHLWLREAFNGISNRVHNGEAPMSGEKLLKLEDTLKQMNELKSCRSSEKK